MHDEPGQRHLDVEDLDLAVRGPAAAPLPTTDQARVGQLAAAFGVERRPVEHDRHRLALRGRGDREVVDEQADDRRLAREVVVPGELDRPGALAQVREHGDVGVAGLLLRGVGLGALALGRHQPPEALLVDREALLPGHLEGQLDREAVGVVQLERLLTGQRRRLLAPGLLHRRVEDRGAGAQRAEERRLLRVEHGEDVGRVAPQLRVQRGHRLDRGTAQLVQVAFSPPEDAARPAAALAAGQHAQVTDAAAEEPAQHVAAPLVAGQHAVLDQHHRRAHVVGDDLQRDVGPRVAGRTAAR